MTDTQAASHASARSHFYAFLAAALADPTVSGEAELQALLPAAETAVATLDRPRSRAAMVALRSELSSGHGCDLAAAYRRVFGLGVSGDCPPYEGEYGSAHIFQKTHILADNAGFLKAFGLDPAPGFADRQDHIAVELEFLHVLAAKEAYALVRDHDEEHLAILGNATRRYLKDHLGRWAPEFARRLEAKAEAGPYAALARLLAAFIAEELLAFGVAPEAASPVMPAWRAEDAEASCQGCVAAEAFGSALRGAP